MLNIHMTKRTTQKAHTRITILNAAHELFSIKGFTRVTTLEVAQKAQVSHGSIFAHFANRDELILAAIERFGNLTVGRMHELADKRESLRLILGAHLQCLRENERFYSHLIRECPVLPHRVYFSIIAIQSGISHHIYLAAEREMQAGIIKSVAPDLLFTTWIGLIHHYLMNPEMFGSTKPILEEHGNKLIDHFLHLLSLN
jgi:AcrR family transcriptional regulator